MPLPMAATRGGPSVGRESSQHVGGAWPLAHAELQLEHGLGRGVHAVAGGGGRGQTGCGGGGGPGGACVRASLLRHNTKAKCRSWRHPAPRTSERVRGARPYARVIIMLLSRGCGQPPAGPLSNARLGRTLTFTQAPSRPHQPSFFFDSFFVFILSNTANVHSIPACREGIAAGRRG